MPRKRGGVTQVKPADHSDVLKLNKMVFLGYTDIAAGGSRALLGIDMRKKYYNIDIPELSTNSPACERDTPPDPRERDFTPIQVLNLMYEEFSIIVVNTVVPPEKSHYVCSKIMDLCTESCIEKLIVLGALRLDVPLKDAQDMYENVMNDMPATSYPSLPTETRISDPFLSTLIQMIQVEHQPTSLLLMPAHRACHGKARIEDGSQQVIAKFQEVLNDLTNLKFDTEFSNNLIYKGENTEDTDTVSMMYS